jgi:hypothetical protein
MRSAVPGCEDAAAHGVLGPPKSAAETQAAEPVFP